MAGTAILLLLPRKLRELRIMSAERVIIQKRRTGGAEMNIAFLVGRIIFGGWLMASFNHFKNLNYMSEYAKARATPSPKLAVAGTGVILLLGGLSMLLGVYPVVGIILLPSNCLRW
jgi:uncharacterized membrane protein YphA (DoxX/SURF4 family)